MAGSASWAPCSGARAYAAPRLVGQNHKGYDSSKWDWTDPRWPQTAVRELHADCLEHAVDLDLEQLACGDL